MSPACRSGQRSATEIHDDGKGDREGQGLDESRVAKAAELYGAGLSLARIADQLGMMDTS